MEELKKKIAALIGMMDGKRDLDFICLAFQEVPRGDVAIAVLELCLEGGLVINRGGISLSKEAADGPAGKESVTTPSKEAVDEPAEEVEAPTAEPCASDFPAEKVPGVEYPAAVTRSEDPIDGLGLSTRPANCLARLGISTIGQLVGALSSLEGQPGLGSGSLGEIKRSLNVRAASFSAPLGRRTADELRGVSGSGEYVFDALGVLVCLPASGPSGDEGPLGRQHAIEDLGLGDAVNRRLRVNGISTVEGVLRMSPASLAAVPHLGTGSVAKVKSAVTAFCSRAGLDMGAWGDGGVCVSSVDELLDAGGAELRSIVESVEATCRQRLYPVHEKSLRVFAAEFAWQRLSEDADSCKIAEEFVQGLEHLDALGPICKAVLVNRCRRALAEDNGASVKVPNARPWLELSGQLTSVDGAKVSFDARECALHLELRSVGEWLDGLDDARIARPVRQRLEGKTLQEIGEAEGVTRERIRQVVDAALRRARPLKEDEWQGLFEAYDLNQEQFAAITGLGQLSFGYLSLTAKSKRAERRPLVQALEDAGVSDWVKGAIRDGNILTDCVFDGDELIAANKADIIKHLLVQRVGGPALTLEELYDGYRAFLASHGLEESGRLDPTGLRAFGALLDRTSFVMCAKTPADEDGDRRGIRYYDSEARDFSPLVAAISKLAEKFDAEISAEALMTEASLADVLAPLDIRNGYELHQVLYAWCADIPGVRLGRAPMLTLGAGDRRRQVLELISEIGPVDVGRLADEYAARYGVRPMTFKANYLDGLEQYSHDGLYSYEAAALDEGQLATLRGILTPVQGWCSAAMVREKFLSRYSSWSGELVTAENMARAGFSICDGLLVRDGFDLRSAFAGMIAGAQSFRLCEGEFTGDVCSNSVFVSELNKAVRRFEVLEVRKGEYLSIKAFAGGMAPMTPEGFSSFVDGIVARMVPDRPYSVKSLRALGLMDELDAVAKAQGLDDFFEESVLSLGYVGGALKRTSVAFTSLFARTAGGFSVCDAIEWYVRRRGSLSVQQLADILESEHGVVANLANLRFAVQRSSLEFDAERDMAILPEGTSLLEEGLALLPMEKPEEDASPERAAEEEKADEAVSVEEAPDSVDVAGLEDQLDHAEGARSELATFGEASVALESDGPTEDAEAPAETPEGVASAAMPFRGYLVAEGGLVISADAGDATLKGRPLGLTPSEFALLATMASAPGKLFTREELCDALFGGLCYADGRTVDSHIKNLRAKLGDDPRDSVWISTVHGSGYRFDAEVDASGAEGMEGPAASSAEYASADGTSRLLIDEAAHRVRLNGEEVALTRSEYQLLDRLAQDAPEVRTRLELCNMIGIQASSDLDARSVDSHLKNLRKALGDDARNPTWIGTAHGRGYFFLGERVPDADESDGGVDGLSAEPELASGIVQDELKSEVARLEAELAERMAALEEKECLREEYRSLGRRIPELEADVRSCGFFQRSEKRAAQAKLDEARARLQSLKGEGSGMGLIRREVEELQDRLTELKARLENI